jgi:repressor LexA
MSERLVGTQVLESLPPRQRDVLRYIIELTEEHGYPPTLAELAKALGLRNRMTVHQHVAALKKKGFVHWEPGLNRSLKVIGQATAVASRREQTLDDTIDGDKVEAPIGLPLAGTIAAGHPIDALETDEYLKVESQYAEAGCFALKIKGDSMIDDGIYDGDFVIIKPNPSPRNGEIVVAVLEDGNATLKRFFKEKNGFRLQPANKDLEPIFVESSNDMQIKGTVVALFRKM